MNVQREMTKEEMREKLHKQAEEIKSLKERELFLLDLESLGVDNWQGYSDAWEVFEELKDDQKS